MLYAIICRDKPGHIETRKANRDAHIAYIKGSGVLQMAGPFLDDAGVMCGSLLVIDVADKAAAQHFADGDPYAHAGLFEAVDIQAWNKVIG